MDSQNRRAKRILGLTLVAASGVLVCIMIYAYTELGRREKRKELDSRATPLEKEDRDGTQ